MSEEVEITDRELRSAVNDFCAYFACVAVKDTDLDMHVQLLRKVLPAFVRVIEHGNEWSVADEVRLRGLDMAADIVRARTS